MSRQLVIMGSGEVTPGMLGVHRAVFATLPAQPRCVLLDSPFAFQENADELVERIGQYFTESLGHPVSRIHLPAEADALTRERALAKVRAADWVFAGPGSPSYARRCWADTAVPTGLAELLEPGRNAALVFASAAAVTLGEWSLPVYEIYKVGEDPRWEPGLGLMSRVLGWRCAVVPHYDNQEGGTHDTRYCWIGERRLRAIEAGVADGFILGVDEHTALVVDLDEGTAKVAGRGGVTLRRSGVEEVLAAGTRVAIDDLTEMAATVGDRPAGDQGGGSDMAASGRTGSRPAAIRPATPPNSPDVGRLAGAARGCEAVALDTGADAAHLAALVLAALPRTETAARSAVVHLADLAECGAKDQGRSLAGPAVQALVDDRARARALGDWARSDELRAVLTGLGIEVRDTPEGSNWRWT